MKKPRGVTVAGNWKMNHGPKATVEFLTSLQSRIDPGVQAALKKSEICAGVFVPAVSLQAAQENRGSLFIGAQNAHWEKAGAFTGELSAPLLQELGIHWALVGHSERRQYFGETDESVRKRSESLLAQGMRVVLCIGETRSEREANQTEEVLSRQIDGAFPSPGVGASAYLDGRLILAYEPVWAIGTGLTASPEQAEEAHAFIRSRLAHRFSVEAASKTSILYGGSVTPDNFKQLLACPNVDGGLVGGASLKPESYNALLGAALLSL